MKKLLTNFSNLTILLILMVSPLAISSSHSSDIFSSNTSGLFSSQPKLLPVDEAFVLDSQQHGQRLKINWVIADGYYLYRDKLKFTASNATIGNIELPPAELHTDEYFGEQSVYYSYIEVPIALTQAGAPATVSVTFQGCADKLLCYPPTTRDISLTPVTVNDSNTDNQGNNASIQTAQTPSSSTSVSALSITSQAGFGQLLENEQLWWILLIFFALGIGLALTPCVFPMYPILSGIIVGQGEKLSTSKAFALSLAYVQGMAITYSLMGLLVASAGLKYQAALQQPAVLVSIAGLFVVLSLSMFGLYQLRLPFSWQQKMDTFSGKFKGGKLVSVFIMGAISGLVASPCTTAPLSGALIYVAQGGDLLQGFLALYLLSLGMGVPLLIVGTSGGKLLPKAGNWMNIIKVIFGFMLLAVAIIMLARIWPGLMEDILWSVWGIALAGYLMHQNKLSAFNWQQSVRSVSLLVLLLVSVSYGFHSSMQAINPSSNTLEGVTSSSNIIKIKSLDDLSQEVSKASAAGKPVMLDLYADWCVACKEFEHITFSHPDVKQRLDHMVFLQADVTKNDLTDIALLEQHSVLGLPTILFFDDNGQVRDDLRVTGFMKPESFSKQLDQLLNQ